MRQSCLQFLYSDWISLAGNNLILFLSGFDVIHETDVAEEALKGFFALNPQMFERFSEDFFAELTPESILTIRVFAETPTGQSAAQDLLPELSKFAVIVDKHIGTVSLSCDETELEKNQFILEQLFKVCAMLDMADEAGRRSLSDTLFGSLIHEDLSDTNVSGVLELLKRCSSGIADFER